MWVVVSNFAIKEKREYSWRGMLVEGECFLNMRALTPYFTDGSSFVIGKKVKNMGLKQRR